MGFKHGKPLRSFWIHGEQAAGEMFGCLCYAGCVAVRPLLKLDELEARLVFGRLGIF